MAIVFLSKFPKANDLLGFLKSGFVFIKSKNRSYSGYVFYSKNKILCINHTPKNKMHSKTYTVVSRIS